MPKLEYTKAGFNFDKLKKLEPEYGHDEFFPPGVNIIEPAHDATFTKIFKAYPETPKQVFERSIDIIQNLAKTAQANGKKFWPKKQAVLHVTHGGHVDNIGWVIDFGKEGMTVQPSEFVDIKDGAKSDIVQKMLDEVSYANPDLCAIDAFECDSKVNGEWIMNRYDKHMDGLHRKDLKEGEL